ARQNYEGTTFGLLTLPYCHFLMCVFSHCFCHMSMRFLLFLSLAAAFAVSRSFAQPLLSFQSAASGEWTDSRNWEKNDGGIWLKSTAYPGDQYDKTADVAVRDGSSISVGKDEVVRINSLL